MIMSIQKKRSIAVYPTKQKHYSGRSPYSQRNTGLILNLKTTHQGLNNQVPAIN